MDLAQNLDLLLPVIKYLLYRDFPVEILTRKDPKVQTKHLSEAFPCPPQSRLECMLTRVSDSFARKRTSTSVLYLWSLTGEELARLGI